jgi:hypothetical protein
MTSQREFLKESEDEFWFSIEGGFGIRANKCIYVYGVAKDVATCIPKQIFNYLLGYYRVEDESYF